MNTASEVRKIHKFIKKRTLLALVMTFVFLITSLVFDSIGLTGYKYSNDNVAFATEKTDASQYSRSELITSELSSTKLLAAKPSSGGFKSSSMSGSKSGSSSGSSSSKSSSGGFKSGSFSNSNSGKSSGSSDSSSSGSSSSKSSSGGFKSGGFSNSKDSTPSNSDKDSSGSSNYEKPKRSFIPIPIPFFGGGGSYRSSYNSPLSIIGAVFKLIIFIILFIVIITLIKKYFRKRK